MSDKLSLVIPILNEEKNILPLTKKIIRYLKQIKYEIIFVDDNSFDNSKKKLNHLNIMISLKTNFRIITHLFKILVFMYQEEPLVIQVLF